MLEVMTMKIKDLNNDEIRALHAHYLKLGCEGCPLIDKHPSKDVIGRQCLWTVNLMTIKKNFLNQEVGNEKSKKRK